eukprot:scaffold10520_cov144-Amphora_coffeaeformis.AAC.2
MTNATVAAAPPPPAAAAAAAAQTTPSTTTRSKWPPPLSPTELETRLQALRCLVAQPFVRGFLDPQPAVLRGGVIIGSKYHAMDVLNCKRLGVTAVLNCASGGISRLPVDEMEEAGIHYAFTNVRQDNYDYPILFHRSNTDSDRDSDNDYECSDHLKVARQLYWDQVVQRNGKILFFCVAGMNRSTCLGLACLMIFGYDLQQALLECAAQRPFVLENKGFQQQLLELQALLPQRCAVTSLNGQYPVVYDYGSPTVMTEDEAMPRTASMEALQNIDWVEIELLIPGLCTMEVRIPTWSTISDVKARLRDHANRHLLTTYDHGREIAKSWLVLAMFGYDSMYDVPLEDEAIDFQVQLQRIQHMFGLKVRKEKRKSMGTSSNSTSALSSSQHNQYMVEWNNKCRFALVIFSVYTTTNTTMPTINETAHSDNNKNNQKRLQEPWTFLHEERPNAPATFLENNLFTTHLRAWDFVTGQAYASAQPIVFSFSNDIRDRRAFMKISTSADQMQQFHAPGEGGILGMGANAIVHRVQLQPTSLASATKGNPNKEEVATKQRRLVRSISRDSDDEELSHQIGWDAAVKRPFGLSKMLASLENSSEAGLAKRMRFANSLNSDGRVLYFYGLGVAMSANMTTPATRQEMEAMESTKKSKFEYKWEAILLARYEEEFSTYTMKRFMQDYTAEIDKLRETDPQRARKVATMQEDFTILNVKILLVSLLNAFRDLTLMGVQAFDFNHLDNILISRDHRSVRLIDIDGNSKGSIQYPSAYIQGNAAVDATVHSKLTPAHVYKPSLDIDLNAVLPTAIHQLILGKGRGVAFVTNMKSEIWRAPPDQAKAMIRQLLKENFYAKPQSESTSDWKEQKHLSKMTEWFYAVLKKEAPWTDWTKDIYDAMVSTAPFHLIPVELLLLLLMPSFY